MVREWELDFMIQLTRIDLCDATVLEWVATSIYKFIKERNYIHLSVLLMRLSISNYQKKLNVLKTSGITHLVASIAYGVLDKQAESATESEFASQCRRVAFLLCRMWWRRIQVCQGVLRVRKGRTAIPGPQNKNVHRLGLKKDSRPRTG